MPRAIIFANGEIPNLDLVSTMLQQDDYFIAADGGVNHLLKIDRVPEIVIGDMDSIGESTLLKLTSTGVKFEPYSKNKDETDIELALHHALELGFSSILLVGALGGRLDQTLANISILSDPLLSGIDVRIDDGTEAVVFCRATKTKIGQIEIHGRKGDTVSLIPWHEPVVGITTEGLQWPLYKETLFPFKTRGISNIMIEDLVTVRVDSGLLLIAHRRISS